MYRIPFNRPTIVGKELFYIAQAIQAGHAAGDGEFTKRSQLLLEEVLGVQKALLTTSCTHALEMAAMLLDVRSGDEIVIPSFTFVTTANAFALRGARPRFIDIRPDTLNMDEAQLEQLISPSTKAIVPVHYAGIGCEMEAILEIADHYHVAVVEDNAHGLFGKHRGKPLGSFGSLAAQSFHETKNVSCGEGGALIINDLQYIERAEIIREKGTNRKRFFRGEVDKYTWVDLGSSYLLSDLLAAFLYAQLEARVEIQAGRRRIWQSYFESLQDWAVNLGVQLPSLPAHCEQSYHMFYLLLPSVEARMRLQEHLKSQSILSVFHYQPLHLSTMGQRFGAKPGDCPVAEDVYDRLLRLPFYNDLTEEDQERVIDAVLQLRW